MGQGLREQARSERGGFVEVGTHGGDASVNSQFNGKLQTVKYYYVTNCSSNVRTGTYRSRLLKQNRTPRRVVKRNAKHTGTTMASISP